jgi:hypothetical protein
MPSLNKDPRGGHRPNAGRPPKGGFTAEQLAERAERKVAYEAARTNPEVMAILDLRAAAKTLVRAATDLERAYRAAEPYIASGIDAGNAVFPDAEARRSVATA